MQTIKLLINYKTHPESNALQWLKPSQTAGKKYPYLFSQCQPILARSMFPCQDSPSCKVCSFCQYTSLMNFFGKT